MNCTCPKCKAEIELDVAGIQPEGSLNKCSACNANLRKESFAKRALYKSTQISCAECGNPPGTSIYCQSCHAIYPDILVIDTSSAAKKKFDKILASLKTFNKIKLTKAAKSQQVSFDGTPAPGKGKGAKGPGQTAQLAGILAVLFLIAAVGGYYWYQDRITTAYSQQCVRAILGLKSARDLDITISNRVANSWKTGGSSSITGAEVKALASAKKDVDTLMKDLGKVPAKFTASYEALNKLYDNFGKLHEAVTATSGTSEAYAVTVKKLDTDFMKSAGELKSGLPAKTADIFNQSKKKYKALQDF